MIHQNDLNQMIESHVSQFRTRLTEDLSTDVARFQKAAGEAEGAATNAQARMAETEKRTAEADAKHAELRATFKALGDKIAARQKELDGLNREHEELELRLKQVREVAQRHVKESQRHLDGVKEILGS